jgi:hypothetical protein
LKRLDNKLKNTQDTAKERSLVGILLGKAATPSKAQAIAGFFNKCPYCVTCINADCTVLGVLSFPQSHRWWFESIAERPKETVGLEGAEVFFAEKITVPSPWSSGETRSDSDRAPCGADCQGCPMYQNQCTGCPATKFYSSDIVSK